MSSKLGLIKNKAGKFAKANKTQLILILAIAIVGISTLVISQAATRSIILNLTSARLFNESGNVYVASGAINFDAATPPATSNDHLKSILATTFRNKNHDNSPFVNTPSASLPTGDTSPLLGPRSEYLNQPGTNPENHFSNPGDTDGGGEFRTACEFSHFAYDDPLVYPNQPRKAHLHMFFGNTHVNAYSTYDSLINSGSSTCNGLELNRTGYWVPATFDAQGYVRIPERVVLYYKGYGLAKKSCEFQGGTRCSNGAEVYPEGMAMVTTDTQNYYTASPAATDTTRVQWKGRLGNELPDNRGGIGGPNLSYANFLCGSNVASVGQDGPSNIIIQPPVPYANRTIPPNCMGYGKPTENLHRTLFQRIAFPNCWNGQDPSKSQNHSYAWVGGWFYSDCAQSGPFNRIFPNLEYHIHYPLDEGETTANWYLSSDVDKATFTKGVGGASIHADWWGGWNKSINREFLDNCVLKSATATDDGPDCGFGYLSDGGNNRNNNPLPGRALKFRPQYTGPTKIHASEIYNQLCKPYTSRPYTKPEDAAWCTP